MVDDGGVDALDAPDDAWSGITAFYSLIHTPRERVQAVLKEFQRVLAPGGHLTAAVWDTLEHTPAYAALVALRPRVEEAVRRARRSGREVLAAATVAAPGTTDPSAAAFASRRDGEPLFVLEQPDRARSALAALGCLTRLEGRGADRFAWRDRYEYHVPAEEVAHPAAEEQETRNKAAAVLAAIAAAETLRAAR